MRFLKRVGAASAVLGLLPAGACVGWVLYAYPNVPAPAPVKAKAGRSHKIDGLSPVASLDNRGA